jgi:[acyl-carrier-protein] S-malonyltransferase
MGASLAEEYPAGREVFETADRVLGRPLARLCFEGSADDLTLTENTQPSILTVSVAALRVLESKGLRPVAAAGHSLGEYTAHVAAGTIEFADAVNAVQSRGRFMQEAVPVGAGAMAAILGLEPAQVAEICTASSDGRVVSPANLNGPSQVVIAGHADAVERAMEAARSAGARRVVPLPVSAPFHCSLMQPAADRLRAVLESIEFSDPGLPVYTNVDAVAVVRGGPARDALVRQVASPVRWQESIESMLSDGIEAFVEVGPGKVLSGLVRGIRKGIPTYQAGEPKGLEKAARELAA